MQQVRICMHCSVAEEKKTNNRNVVAMAYPVHIIDYRKPLCLNIFSIVQINFQNAK